MRARLLEATVDCLVERGFAGTSTTLVSERAGVSRGAQLHHFPTKNDLVVAAVEHLTECAAPSSRPRPRALPDGPRRTRAVLQMLGDHFTSPVFTAALELWVAARTDATLLAAVGAARAAGRPGDPPAHRRAARRRRVRAGRARARAGDPRPGPRPRASPTRSPTTPAGAAASSTSWADTLDDALTDDTRRGAA